MNQVCRRSQANLAGGMSNRRQTMELAVKALLAINMDLIILQIMEHVSRYLIRKARKVDSVCTATFRIPELWTRQKTQIAQTWEPLPKGSINVNTGAFYIAESGAASTEVVTLEYLGNVKPTLGLYCRA